MPPQARRVKHAAAGKAPPSIAIRAPKRPILRPNLVRTMAHVSKCPIFCDFSIKNGTLLSFPPPQLV
jgi:hypothetical protein